MCVTAVAVVLLVEPSPKSHMRLVGFPVEVSTNVTFNGVWPKVGLAVNDATGGGNATVVTVEDKLLARFGSGVRAETATVLLARPTAVVVTTMVTLAPAVFAIVPRLQVRVPLRFVQVPMLLIAETRLTLAGSVSLSKTSDAVFGPALLTLTV